MTDPIRMRRDLATAIKPPVWPSGVTPVSSAKVVPQALHGILTTAYATGLGGVPPFEPWWSGLTTDAEFDPALVFVAVDDGGAPVGLAQCWTSGFVKDIAVSDEWRGQGIGEALLTCAFQSFQQRGLAHVDLKVTATNSTAIRLYCRVGMVEAPL